MTLVHRRFRGETDPKTDDIRAEPNKIFRLRHLIVTRRSGFKQQERQLSL
jgi:hypothetical protein